MRRLNGYKHHCNALCRGSVHVDVYYSPQETTLEEVQAVYRPFGVSVLDLQPETEAPPESPGGESYEFRYRIVIDRLFVPVP